LHTKSIQKELNPISCYNVRSKSNLLEIILNGAQNSYWNKVIPIWKLTIKNKIQEMKNGVW
jgi:hypothetical protein